MLFHIANFLTLGKKDYQSSNLEVCKDVKTIESNFLQLVLSFNSWLDILRRGTWKPGRHQPASRCIGGPAQKSGVVMENERQTEEIKRQVANNSGGYTRVLGVSQGSSLPHSLHESLFQSVHTRSPFFHGQPPHTPIHSQFAAKGSFWNTSPSKLPKSPCQVSSSSSSVFRSLFSCLLPFPYSYPLVIPSRLAGLLCLLCSFFHLSWTQFFFHFTNFYTPFRVPVKITL